MVFWANIAMQKKYRQRFHSFKENAQAKCSEAQCETVFSDAKRTFRAERHGISSENLTKGIVCSAGEKRKATKPMQIKAKYLKIRNESAAERHAVKVASKAAAPVAAPTSTLQAAMDAVAAAGGMDVVMAATQGTI